MGCASHAAGSYIVTVLKYGSVLLLLPFAFATTTREFFLGSFRSQSMQSPWFWFYVPLSLKPGTISHLVDLDFEFDGAITRMEEGFSGDRHRLGTLTEFSFDILIGGFSMASITSLALS